MKLKAENQQTKSIKQKTVSFKIKLINKLIVRPKERESTHRLLISRMKKEVGGGNDRFWGF